MDLVCARGQGEGRHRRRGAAAEVDVGAGVRRRGDGLPDPAAEILVPQPVYLPRGDDVADVVDGVGVLDEVQSVGTEAVLERAISGGPAAERVGGTKNPDVQRIRQLQPGLVHVNLEENLEKHAAAIAAMIATPSVGRVA